MAIAKPPRKALGSDTAVRIVLGFTTGGGADLVARTLAPQLERRTGRRVVVENRPGNTGTAAPEFLKTALAFLRD